MKFMKLGSKPDAFRSDGNGARYVASELATDVVIHVGEVRFYLHKFPLLSKSNRLQKLVAKANEENADEVYVLDFPGGPKAFEICAKFCYGMTVTLNAYNVVAARCAAEYLEMTEDVDRGNLIFKIEVFLNSSVFRSWKDSIIVLQTTKSLLPWSEDLKVVGRCIDSIASKTSVDPSNVNWSYTYNRKFATTDQIVENGSRLQQKLQSSVPKDWWIEDICELEIELYKRVMVGVKSKGRMSGDVIGEALNAYTCRWLPGSVDKLVSDDSAGRYKSLVETVIWLLPSDMDAHCSCGFLLKLLKFATLVGAGDASREMLIKKISLQLDEASVHDLLIPARSPDNTVYDVHLVQSIVDRFMMRDRGPRDSGCVERNDKGAENLILGRCSSIYVGKLVDGYLAEISSDPNLSLSSFINLSESVPDLARPIHDGLYKAIDTYLKEHPGVTKAERKKICGLMDVKKLSMEACVHAAQNERLPLRVVVQVLFYEQVRAAAGGLTTPQNVRRESSRFVTKTEEDWERAMPAEEYKSLQKQMRHLKVGNNECRRTGDKKKIKSRGGFLLPSRSRRIFDKLWAGKGQGQGQGENGSSGTSGSSQSPTTTVNPVETKSSGSSSRQRRHSIS